MSNRSVPLPLKTCRGRFRVCGVCRTETTATVCYYEPYRQSERMLLNSFFPILFLKSLKTIGKMTNRFRH